MNSMILACDVTDVALPHPTNTTTTSTPAPQQSTLPLTASVLLHASFTLMTGPERRSAGCAAAAT